MPSSGSDRHVEELLRWYVDGGCEAIEALNGSFSVVIWDERSASLHAIRDPLGVSPLYCRFSDDGIAVADVSERLAPHQALNKDFIAAFIATGEPPPTNQTVWRQVEAVPAGTTLTWQRASVRRKRYWSPEAFMSRAPGRAAPEASARFRSLLKRSLSQHLEPDQRTWAHLSGGHDSSSVVSVAALVGAERPSVQLGGTLTLIDSIGSGDESSFVDAVLRQHRFRNERVRDMWPWQDDGLPAPVTADPTRDYPFYARDRECGRRMRRHGATSVLSGAGPDLYLPFTDLRASDMLWAGQIRGGVRFAFEWAVAHGESFWKTLRTNALAPVVPQAARTWYHERRLSAAPAWLRADFVAQHGFAQHVVRRHVHPAPPGRRLAALVADRLHGMAASLQGWMAMDGVAVRHPLLYRPLVEHSLQLAQAEFADATAPKWILRRAMDGIVPGPVLARRSKGSLVLPRVCWAFGREHSRIRSILANSILAELGVIEPCKVLDALNHASSGRLGDEALHVYCALSLDTWLLVRSGLYPPQVNPSTRSGNEQ